jgi:hypothetical protein
MESDRPNFRCIGKGFCGSVWAVDRPGVSCALKREDGGPGREIRNDYDIHRKVLASLQDLRKTHAASLPGLAEIQVPQCLNLITPEDEDWWEKQLHRFPKTYEPCRVLVSERIQPLSRSARETLIHHFCPVQLRDIIKADRDNEDCIARVYLGRRRFNAERARRKLFFSLRNYPLHLDQMEELGDIDTLAYARLMADTLAMMHWGAKIDANDVEFVLASPPVSVTMASAYSSPSSSTLGEHSLWLLDFDCANTISMDESGLDQAVAAFWRNDPYYPRPSDSNEHEQRLWGTFKDQFLKTSDEILGADSDCLRLPVLLINKIEEEARVRQERKRANEQKESVKPQDC